MIRIKNLHKRFGDKIVLDGVSIDINTGDTICIIGKSGTGKSVLIKHIVGLLEPDKGEVQVDGKKIEGMPAKDLFNLRRRMGYVFQGAALFDSMNVYENAVLGLYEHGERDTKVLESEAQRVLSAVGLLPDIKEKESENFRREWKILSEKKPSDLSGGMRKRVGVARALVGEPEYIFYDEPTTGLDPVNSEQIDNLIADLTKKIKATSIVITHDMFSVFKVAHSVAMINNGKLQFNGTADELQQSSDPIVQEFLARYE